MYQRTDKKQHNQVAANRFIIIYNMCIEEFVFLLQVDFDNTSAESIYLSKKCH